MDITREETIMKSGIYDTANSDVNVLYPPSTFKLDIESAKTFLWLCNKFEEKEKPISLKNLEASMRRWVQATDNAKKHKK